jgi:hypothetical protein
MTITAAPTAVPDLLGTSPADLLDTVDEAPVATLDEARMRAERIRAGLESYTQMRQDIADAFARRDWLALDYPSWFTYLEGEYGDELKRLTRSERPGAVADLREQGLSQRAIGAALGVSKRTVETDLAQVATSSHLPAAITGTDGKTYAAKRPERPPFPGPADMSTRPVDPGATPAPAVESPTAPVAPREPAPVDSADLSQLKAEMARESERRTAIASIRSVLTYLTSRVLSPEQVAQQYAQALAEFTAADLAFAAKTMAALAALKEQ